MKQDLGLPYSQETQRFREREVDRTWMQEGVPGTGDAERNSHSSAVTHLFTKLTCNVGAVVPVLQLKK